MSQTEKNIIRFLRLLTQKLDAHNRKLLTQHGMTMPQILCLDELNEKGAIALNTLAEGIQLSPSTTVGIVDRLEKKKFVKRRRDIKDRRVVFIDITSEGREFIIKTPLLLHNKLSGKLENLVAGRKEQISTALAMLLQLIST